MAPWCQGQARGKVQGEPASGAGRAGGDGDQVGTDGSRSGTGVGTFGQGAGSAGEVVRDGGQGEPGGVRGELPRGQMRERTGFEVGDDMLDDRVAAVVGFGLEHRQGRVGQDRVVTEGGEQLPLPID